MFQKMEKILARIPSIRPMPTPQGLGTDIIEMERIQEAIDRHGPRFIDRLFTEKEQAYCTTFNNPTPHYAGRFAAKEAILKALGTGLQGEITWKDIEILNDPQGKPEVYLSSSLKERYPNTQILISISHCKSFATATAILYS